MKRGFPVTPLLVCLLELYYWTKLKGEIRDELTKRFRGREMEGKEMKKNEPVSDQLTPLYLTGCQYKSTNITFEESKLILKWGKSLKSSNIQYHLR